ncbi:hypothetical protein [Roseateles asaccharophilus]|uniref:Uncharacterized protein n=1 Tax=Roseateles asaccharophilus TaxID=582607 RepID=A0ABU2AFC1_9BURK|nr:hypothetical protein [Roseateles asaccharophilus]MDR7335919.1 hypothetical protein [Roseateles asaccharophilus]
MNATTSSRRGALKPAVLAGLLLLAAGTASAHCWAADAAEPISNDGLPVNHASFKPLHAAMDVFEAQAKPNPGLLALPDVRLRITRAVLDSDEPTRRPREAVIHAQGFGPKTWTGKDCGISEQAAHRIGPRAGFSVFFNSPFSTMNRWAHDEQLSAYLEGERGEPMQGWPVYRHCAVIGPERRIPWMPVPVGEMLAYFEREQQRRLADWDRSNAQALKPFDLAGMERQAEKVRAQNAQAADLLLKVARDRKANEARNHALLAHSRQMLVDELEDLRRTRAAMSAEQLAEPYRLGTGRHRLPTPAEVTRPLKRLVKLDPTFPWDARNRTRIQLLTVCASTHPNNPAYAQPMRAAVAALDLASLAALLN